MTQLPAGAADAAAVTEVVGALESSHLAWVTYEKELGDR